MMTKQEAIELVKNTSYSVPIKNSVKYLREETVIKIIDELDEPEKPVLPQFVADWIEWCKNNNVTLLGAMSPIDELGTAICDDKKVKSLDASEWGTQNQETFAQAWLFGYEIEKEKLYTARLKLISVKKYSYINREKDEKRLFISDSDGLTDVYQTHFTQAELEELDVWNNPAFEIEEVEK